MKDYLLTVCDRALRAFGDAIQKWVAIEEMAELTKEISKTVRGGRDYDKIAEEIADVEIMLEQLKIIYCCRHKVDQEIIRKLHRLDEIINKHETE